MERQAGVAIEGVEQHNRSHDRTRLSILAVDTHGYTNPAMMVAKGLGFDLCPRLRDLAERKLYLPMGFAVPENVERMTSKRLSLKAIRVGYDDVQRLIASVRCGRISADLALRYLGSAAQGDPMYRAAEHLERMLRSIFLCDYITIKDFRREIHTLLSRGESVHQLQRAIHPGVVSQDPRVGPRAPARRDEGNLRVARAPDQHRSGMEYQPDGCRPGPASKKWREDRRLVATPDRARAFRSHKLPRNFPLRDRQVRTSLDTRKAPNLCRSAPMISARDKSGAYAQCQRICRFEVQTGHLEDPPSPVVFFHNRPRPAVSARR
jgi:hypothetical protein